MKHEEVPVAVRKEFKAGDKLPDGTAATGPVVKSVQVSKISVPIYDSLSEAVEHETEVKVLELFNSQNKTNLMNTERAKFNSKPSRASLEEAALKKFTQEDWQKVQGDASQFTKIRDAYIDAALAEIEAQRGAAVGGGSEANGSDVAVAEGAAA